jgi:segregation and condensation protein B
LSGAVLNESVQVLNRAYKLQGRPYAIETEEDGYVLRVKGRFKPIVDRLYGQTRSARLSAAAVDVLSLVAYRQPVTKQEIDAIRGAESGSLLRQLVRRGLIAIARRAEAGHREVTYATTQRFLDLFKLTTLDDLPRTQDLQRL